MATVPSSSIPDGTTCSVQDILTPSVFLHCLTFEQGVGLTIVTVAGFFSFLAVLYFFARVLWNVISNKSGQRLVRRPLDVYMLSLFSANILHAAGETINSKWLHEGKVHSGGACWAQGIMQGAGSTAFALTTIAIAVHTFFVLVWARGINALYVARIAVVFLWTLTAVIAIALAVSHRNPQQHFFAPTPYWCWINGPIGFRLVAEYLWLWMALMVSVLTYVPLFFWSLRFIKDKEQKRIAFVMLIYPVVYSVLVIPLSVVRWIQFAQEAKGPSHVPFSATLSVEALFNLAGVIDVVVFFTTRRGLLLFGDDEDAEMREKRDTASSADES